MLSEYGGKNGRGVGMSGVHGRHYSQNRKRVSQKRHLPVSSFHENEARELEAAVGGRAGVKSIANTPLYQNMKYTEI